MRKALVFSMILALALAGCAPEQQAQMGKAMSQVSRAAGTAQGLAHQLDNVYAFLVAQKAVPDNLDAATKALAALDAIAPTVQAGADELTGDKFNWAQFVINAAMVAAQVMGFAAPLL